MGTRIRGLLAVVPPNERTRDDLVEHYGQEEADRIAATTGVQRVHVVSSRQTAADLAEQAATRLLNQLEVSFRDVQGLIFVSQTPDFVLPATACLLQDRLGLPKNSLAFDVNLGCSAYPYGLSIANGLLAGGTADRILLLVADTISKRIHPEDKGSSLLFGDAATATLLEKDHLSNDMLGFDLGTDGAGWRNLVVPVGQCRYQSTDILSDSAPNELQRLPHPEHIHMNGAEIFTFTLREVPGIVERTLANANMQNEDVDYYFFHQANKFILDHLIRKMRLPPEKCPLSIDRYGNTSGPSPGVTACLTASNDNRDRELVAMFIGFGVGYSWGGSLVRLQKGTVFPIEEIVPADESGTK